ncbi:MAG: enoyl-CoA hydratase/isomerase family protein [Myxococcales bacterium]|nr:enoyl-CoA hydratase/isomerase family protein [Myxococcales bacterium]
MEPERVLYERRGPIALLTLNRPDKLNAIDAKTVVALGECLDKAEADDQVRVVVLNGAGRAFSAGFDLDMGEGEGVEFLRTELRKDFNAIMRFWDFPKPTIAAVHKYCLGSGMEMAVACDITIAAEGCRFGAPEVKFGSGIVALILPWVIGLKQAKELLLTGDDRVTTERALALGLINKVVPEGSHLDEALAVARTIAANDRIAVVATKEAINRGADVMGMRQGLLQGLELGVYAEAAETPESKEFNEIVEKEGPKAALAWQEARIARETAAPE